MHISHRDILIALIGVLLDLDFAVVAILLATLNVFLLNRRLVVSLAAAAPVGSVGIFFNFGLAVLLTQKGEVTSLPGLHLCSSLAKQANLAPLRTVAQGSTHNQVGALRLEAFGFDCEVVSHALVCSIDILTPVVDHPDVDAAILREHINLERVRRATLLPPILQQLLLVAARQHSVRLGRPGVPD